MVPIATIQICDHREVSTTKDGKTHTEPCQERAEITISFTDLEDGTRYECDLCAIHKKGLVSQSRPASPATLPSGYTTKTQLPKAGPKKPTIDSAVKDWAISQGGDIAASINVRGRQPKALKEQFLDTPQGKVWQQTNG